MKVIGPLEPEPLEKEYQEPEPFGEKIRSWSHLQKSQVPERLQKITSTDFFTFLHVFPNLIDNQKQELE